ncbi:MAG: RNA polymerase sigma factor [Myxococcota bacterium]
MNISNTPVHSDDARRQVEARWLQATREGDTRAFELLYQRYAPGLLGFILQRVPNRSEAEELLQETFMRLLKDRRFEPTRATVGTWLYVIARNLTLNHVRDHGARRCLPLEEASPGEWSTDEEASPEFSLGQHQQLQALEVALQGLPEAQREAFLLRHRHQRSYQEIAEIVSCPVGTAKSRVHLAISSLRAVLEPALDNVRPLVRPRA